MKPPRIPKPPRVRPRKSMGQVFLTDHNIIRKIVEAAEIQPGESVLEIGPGPGQLTRALAGKASRVIAIELDRGLHTTLRKTLADLDNVELIQSDALSFNYERIPGPVKVVANLPYTIATPLIFRLLSVGTRIPLMILMVQKEVAQRMLARAGEKTYGMMTVSLQYYARTEQVRAVPRTCFSPRPRVDSTVVRLQCLEAPPEPIPHPEWFFKVLRLGFRHRRKFLSNALGEIGLPPEKVLEAFHRANIDPRRRAETLNFKEFGLLTEQLFELQSHL